MAFVGKPREWKVPGVLVWGLIVSVLRVCPRARASEYSHHICDHASCYLPKGSPSSLIFLQNKVPRFLRAVTYVLLVFQKYLVAGGRLGSGRFMETFAAWAR